MRFGGVHRLASSASRSIRFSSEKQARSLLSGRGSTRGQHAPQSCNCESRLPTGPLYSAIRGIGPATVKRLLREIWSADAVRGGAEESPVAVVGAANARRIQEHFDAGAKAQQLWRTTIVRSSPISRPSTKDCTESTIAWIIPSGPAPAWMRQTMAKPASPNASPSSRSASTTPSV